MGFEKLGDSIESLMENESIESLRDRLGQFNRDTLEALLQARDDVSEAVSHRVVEQVEGVRSQVMQQVEQVQVEAQRRLESLQRQAQRRAEETRKAAMIAAWWLFCMAVTSLTTAAIAGTLGVTGLHIGNWSI
jgi:gas vesicle protein